MSTGIWTEKYRPDTLENYLGNEHIRQKVQTWIDTNDIPHLLFAGRAGTGKTTLAKLLVKNIDCDYLMINASDENSVDTIRNKIKGFVATMSFKPLKIVVLDEADHITPQGQAALRNLMEKFSNTSRFILTCNYGERIIEPIHSRCQDVNLSPPNMQVTAAHLVKILDQEGVKYVPEDVVTLVKTYYPDVRKIINTAQLFSKGGTLSVDKTQLVGSDVKQRVFKVLTDPHEKATTRFRVIRKIVHEAGVKDYSEIYSFIFESLSEFDENSQPAVVLALADAQAKASFVVDQEINFAACIWKIMESM